MTERNAHVFLIEADDALLNNAHVVRVAVCFNAGARSQRLLWASVHSGVVFPVGDRPAPSAPLYGHSVFSQGKVWNVDRSTSGESSWTSNWPSGLCRNSRARRSLRSPKIAQPIT